MDIGAAPNFSPLTAKATAVHGDIFSFSNTDTLLEYGDLSAGLYNFYANALAPVTFSIEHVQQSKLDPTIVHYRLEQKINGIPVVNAGFTVAVETDGSPVDGLAPGGGPGPADCDLIRLLNGNLAEIDTYNGVAILDTSSIKDSLLNIVPTIAAFTNSAKWIISSSNQRVLNYQLAARNNQGQNYIYIVDPFSGAVISVDASDNYIAAPTEYYGSQEMLETPIENGFRLEANLDFGNNSTSIFTFDQLRGIGTNWDIDESEIETRSSNGSWPIDLLAPRLSRFLYQTHFSATEVVEPLSDLGIQFENVFVFAVGEDNAISRSVRFYDDTENSYIKIGRLSASSSATGFEETFATHDIVTHELAHTFFGRNIANKVDDLYAIDEGVADIIGTYVESVLQGGVIDLTIGDDTPNGAQLFDTRPTSLDNHPFGCYSDLNQCDVTDRGSTCRYDRSGPILKWFSNLVIGDNSLEIDQLPIEDVTMIVVESVLELDEESTELIDFRDATLAVTLAHFGLCSKEFTAVARSWNEVCLGNTPVCPIVVSGSRNICIDNFEGVVSYYIQEPIPGVTYRWTFPPNWSVYGVPPNTGTKDGTGILVTQFPTYNSYPKSLLVDVWPMELGSQFRERFYVRLKDCTNGPCIGSLRTNGTHEYSNQILGQTNGEAPGDHVIKRGVIRDILGRQLEIIPGDSERSIILEFQRKKYPLSPICFISFETENGNLIRTIKVASNNSFR